MRDAAFEYAEFAYSAFRSSEGGCCSERVSMLSGLVGRSSEPLSINVVLCFCLHMVSRVGVSTDATHSIVEQSNARPCIAR